DRGEGRQAKGVVKQSAGGEARGFGHEFAVLEKHADHGFAHHHQAHGGRYGDERNDTQGKGQRGFHLFHGAGGGLVGHHRQNRRGHGDGVAAHDQFHDPFGHVERGDAARGHAAGRGENRAQEEIDLRHANAEKSRRQQS